MKYGIYDGQERIYCAVISFAVVAWLEGGPANFRLGRLAAPLAGDLFPPIRRDAPRFEPTASSTHPLAQPKQFRLSMSPALKAFGVEGRADEHPYVDLATVPPCRDFNCNYDPWNYNLKDGISCEFSKPGSSPNSHGAKGSRTPTCRRPLKGQGAVLSKPILAGRHQAKGGEARSGSTRRLQDADRISRWRHRRVSLWIRKERTREYRR